MNRSHRDELKGRLIRNQSGKVDYLDFQNRCVARVGPAAAIFLRQLLYWTGKQHDPAGWIFKTRAEMEQETGLSRKQQEKARKILGKRGVLKEDKRGLPRRLWYWVDLEALLRIMESSHSTMNRRKRNQDSDDGSEQMNGIGYYSQDHITDHSWKVDSTVPASEYSNSGPTSEYGNNGPTSEDGIKGRAITESTAETTPERSSEKYLSEKSRWQRGESRAKRGLSPPLADVNIINHKSPIDNRELNRIYPALTTPGSEAYQAYQRHREGSLSLEELANEVCHALTGSRERAESYIEPVQRWVAELAIDEAAADQPIREE
jgi:hypothetical protein